jgi:hypothetical protein
MVAFEDTATKDDSSDTPNLLAGCDLNPANLSAISQTMGHATTKTTEGHYGRISNDRAINDIEKAWTSSPEVPKVAKVDLTGYANDVFFKPATPGRCIPSLAGACPR